MHFVPFLLRHVFPLPRNGGEGRGEGAASLQKSRVLARDSVPPHPAPCPPASGERGEGTQLHCLGAYFFVPSKLMTMYTSSPTAGLSLSMPNSERLRVTSAEKPV